MEHSSTKTPLYPQVPDSNPDLSSPFLSSLHRPSQTDAASAPPAPTSCLYPSLDMDDLAENLFAEPGPEASAPPLMPPPVEETILRVPGAVLHLIDAHASVELGSGDFSIVRLRQSENVVAVLARIGEDLVQWPLARDEAAVKLDDSHYFFSLHVPPTADDPSGDLLNYGLTFASKGQDHLLVELDGILESYSSFSVQKVEVKEKSSAAAEVVDGSVAKEVTPDEGMGSKKVMMEQRSAAYWTTLAPNVEDYSSSAAKAIAKGSGKLVKGILWCGDVTVDRLKWGEEVMRRRMSPNSKPTEISKDAIKRMKRAKRVTKMSHKVANGVLSGVVKVSGFVASSIVNSKVGNKFIRLLPGEVVLASLDGFGNIFDAVEVAGKNVMETSSVVTTGLVSHRYGDQAGEIAHEGLDAAGHAFGTAWAALKIRKALNPKHFIKPTTLAKSAVKAAAKDLKANNPK